MVNSLRNYFVVIFLIVCFFGAENMISYAKESQIQETMSAEEFYRALHFRASSDEELKEISIERVLAADEWIAILFLSTNDISRYLAVGVYDLQGQLKFSKAFNTTGDAEIYIDQTGQCLVVFVVRGQLHCTFDNEGNLIEIERGAIKKYNTKKKKNVDGYGNEYYLTTGNQLADFILLERNAVCRKNPQGETEIFYKTDSKPFVSYLIEIFPLIMGCLIAYFGIKYDFFKIKHMKKK